MMQRISTGIFPASANDGHDIYSYKSENHMKRSTRFFPAIVTTLTGLSLFLSPVSLPAETVVDSSFENYPFSFHEGLGLIAINQKPEEKILGWDFKYGYIDKTGKMVIPPRYESATFFSEGLALVSTVHPVESTSRYQQYERKFFYIDTAGNMTIEHSEKLIYTGRFSGGLAVVEDIKTRKFGYIDKKGKVVIEPIYIDAHSFHDGLALVTRYDPDSGSASNIFIDSNNNVKISLPPGVVCESTFHDGYTYCEWDNPEIDNARVFPPPPPPGGTYYQEPWKHMNDSYGFYNKEGILLILPYNIYKGYRFSAGLAAVSRTKPSFSERYLEHSLWDYMWEYIDTRGNRVFKGTYKFASPFSEQMAVVGKDDGMSLRYGYINRKGEEVTPFQYFEPQPFSEGMAFVIMYDSPEAGYINPDGEFVIKGLCQGNPFREGVAMVGRCNTSGTKIDSYSYINQKGEIIYQFKVNPFNSNQAYGSGTYSR